MTPARSTSARFGALRRSYLLPWIVLILITGFLSTSVLSYLVSRQSLRTTLAEQALPLTGNTIYSEIQKDVLQPVFISAEMANNTFLRDWLTGGERDRNKVVRYLWAIRAKHRTVTAFVVSEKSRLYYYTGGVLVKVNPASARDAWYARVRQMKVPYEINVAIDDSATQLPVIFINYRMLDDQGRFIGVTGVGLALDRVWALLRSYEEKYHRRIYFVNQKGELLIAQTYAQTYAQGSPTNVRTLPGVSGIAEQILAGGAEPLSLSYRRGGAMVLVNSRFLPELKWYLVVEQDEAAVLRPLQRVLGVNLLVSALATLLVLGVTVPTIRRYQSRLERAAHTDGLTGLLNRQAFDARFGEVLSAAHRSHQPLSALLFDIDHFKQVNDTYGHPAGDRVIRELAALVRRQARPQDLVARWGGEEFMILLPHCSASGALALAETLRREVAHSFGAGNGPQVTVSIGVATLDPAESADAFFTRADQALYRAKQAGRNRVET